MSVTASDVVVILGLTAQPAPRVANGATAKEISLTRYRRGVRRGERAVCMLLPSVVAWVVMLHLPFQFPTHQGWPNDWCIPDKNHRIAEIVFEVAQGCKYLWAAELLPVAGIRPMRRRFSVTGANSAFGCCDQGLSAFWDVLGIFLQSFGGLGNFTNVAGVIGKASAIHDHWVASTGSPCFGFRVARLVSGRHPKWGHDHGSKKTIQGLS